MNIYSTMAYKNLSKNKKRTIATVIGIIIAVGLICFITTLLYSFQKSMITFARKNIGDYHIFIQHVSTKELPKIEEIGESIKIQKLGISQIVGQANYKTKNAFRQGIIIEEYDEVAMQSRALQLLEGRLPENEREIVISNYLAENVKEKLDLGSKITLNVEKIKLRVERGETGEEIKKLEQSEQEQITYTITGIIRQTREEALANGYIVIAKLNLLNDDKSCNVSVLLQRPEQSKSFSNRLEELESRNSHFNITENDELLLWQNAIVEVKGANSNIKLQLELIGSITIIIILLISMILIKNSFYISICDRLKEFALLTSIGANKKQIKKMILYEAVFYSIISIPIGIFLGTGIVFLGVVGINHLFAMENIQIQFSTSIIPITISTILMLIAIFISCIKPIKRALKVAPIEGIQQNVQIRAKNNKKNSWIERNIGIEGKIAFKNLEHNKLQYKTTTISICMIVVLIFLSNNIVQYILEKYTDIYPENYNIEIECNIDAIPYNMQFEYYDKIKQIKDIKEYCICIGFNAKINKEKILVIAGEGQVFNQYLERIGLNYQDFYSPGIFIKGEEAEEIDKKEGENLLIEKNHKVYTIPIIKKAKYSPWRAMQTLNISQNFETKDIHRVVIPIQMAKSMILEEKEPPISSYIGMKINSSNPNELEREISRMVMNESILVYNYQSMRETNQRTILVVNIFLYGVLITIFIISISNIYNTIMASMNLRRKEFYILKTIGMEGKKFRKMFFYESFFYTIKALTLGTIIRFCYYLWYLFHVRG